jgi:hypothetical protein
MFTSKNILVSGSGIVHGLNKFQVVYNEYSLEYRKYFL